jgi:hypothetical protein
MFTKTTAIIPLNNINGTLLVTETRCVFHEVGSKFYKKNSGNEIVRENQNVKQATRSVKRGLENRREHHEMFSSS